MSHGSNIISARLVARVADFVRWVGERLFADPDEVARSRGWEITPRWAGLARTYRDPRLQFRLPCVQCRNAVALFPGGICAECEARARLLLDGYTDAVLQARRDAHAAWNEPTRRSGQPTHEPATHNEAGERHPELTGGW